LHSPIHCIEIGIAHGFEHVPLGLVRDVDEAEAETFTLDDFAVEGGISAGDGLIAIDKPELTDNV
jgi:hypothetical protein